MQPRNVAARFIEMQVTCGYVCARPKGGHFHYGMQELRELMDFIYGGGPKAAGDAIAYELGAGRQAEAILATEARRALVRQQIK